MSTSPIYVTMIDNFMSGWGEAEGKTNIYMVSCDTLEQAKQIETAGKARDEMRKVHIHESEPHYNPKQYLVTEVQFKDLGPIWTGEVAA